MKKLLIVVVGIIIVGFGIYFITKNSSNNSEVQNTSETSTGVVSSNTPSPEVKVDEQKNAPEVIIGSSLEKRDITAHRYGTGDTELLFIGGIHGGYSWNTTLLAYQLMDYLKQNPDAVPEGIKVTVIPVLNPDGLNKVVDASSRFESSDVSKSQSDLVAGRFNANKVDLNRNFDCDWEASSTWQNKTVSGGENAFSEPESLALKSYVEKNKPDAVVAFYSAAGGVYASNCHNGVSSETNEITEEYANASRYVAHQDFDFYEVTGDMTNWLAKNNIPAISVLLSNHTDIEWSKNKAGIESLLKYYSK